MIFKSKQDKYDQFQIIDQNLIINNELLNTQLGLLVRLQSLPDNWQFSVKQFSKMYNVSEYSLRKDLKVLESLGYILMIKMRNKGKFEKTVLVISDTPILFQDRNTILQHLDTTFFLNYFN